MRSIADEVLCPLRHAGSVREDREELELDTEFSEWGQRGGGGGGGGEEGVIWPCPNDGWGAVHAALWH